MSPVSRFASSTRTAWIALPAAGIGSGGGSDPRGLTFDLVLGHRDLDTVLVYDDVLDTEGAGGPDVTLDNAGSGIDQPRALVVARDRLIVGNVGNDTVGIFVGVATLADGQAPDVVLDNAGSGVAKPKVIRVTAADDPIVVSSDDNLVQIWRNFTTVVSGQAPDVVLDGPGSGLADPSGIAVASGNLHVGDYGDDQVLVFHDVATLVSGQAADVVLDAAGSSVSAPQHVLVAGNVLYVMEPDASGGSKMLAFQPADARTSGQAPFAVLNDVASGLHTANSVARSGDALFVGNRRLDPATAGPSVIRFDGAGTLISGQLPADSIDDTEGVDATDEVVVTGGVRFVAIVDDAATTPGGCAIYRDALQRQNGTPPDILLGGPELQRTVGLAVHVHEDRRAAARGRREATDRPRPEA
jgi:hypothetical protein